MYIPIYYWNMEKSQLLSEIELRARHSVQEFKEYNQRKDNRVRKCNFQWTSAATMILIENVEKFENLWNPSYCSYKDRKTHQKSWERIAKSLSLPKQEVVVKWNSLRSNYRIYLKNRRGITSGREGKQRTPHPFFLAMAFLDPVLKINTKNSESNLSKKENSKNTTSEVQPGSSNVFTDLDNNVIDTTNKDSNPANVSEIKDETSSILSDENLLLVSQLGDSSQQESRPPILLHKKICNKRKMQILDDHKEESQEEAEEDLESLKKTKLKLEIYNLKLDAVKKEIDLGLEKSQFTAELYENWDVPINEEI